jgi:hypothetical protein
MFAPLRRDDRPGEYLDVLSDYSDDMHREEKRAILLWVMYDLIIVDPVRR